MRLPGRLRRCGRGIPATHLFLVLLLSMASFPTLAGPTLPSPEQDRAVYFELDGPKGPGVLDPGKPVRLAVYYTRAHGGKDRIVAIFEGKPFVRRLVPMTAEPDRTAFRSSVTLEPSTRGFISPREKALRVNVTFARLHAMQLTPFMTRSVYVTMRPPREIRALSTATLDEAKQRPPDDRLPDLRRAGGSATDEEPDSIAEQDLIAGSLHSEEQAYWQHISHLISRSWSGPLRSSGRMKPKGMVTVRFRLHANGEAQLVQVERSSGILELDEAGMEAILNAHPFPPIPSPLSHDWVNMHVELSRSAPTVARSLPPASPLDRPEGSR